MFQHATQHNRDSVRVKMAAGFCINSDVEHNNCMGEISFRPLFNCLLLKFGLCMIEQGFILDWGTRYTTFEKLTSAQMVGQDREIAKHFILCKLYITDSICGEGPRLK